MTRETATATGTPDSVLAAEVAHDIARWESHLNPAIRAWERRLVHVGGANQGGGPADEAAPGALTPGTSLAFEVPLAMGATWYALVFWWASLALSNLSAWNSALSPQASAVAEPRVRAQARRRGARGATH